MLAILREIFNLLFKREPQFEDKSTAPAVVELPPAHDKPRFAFNAPRRKIKKVYIHCSASDNPAHDNVETIRQWHLARGFNDIGYHFLIDSDGKTHNGRSIELTPAAQKWHNKRTIAICVTGLRQFEMEQFDELRELCDSIRRTLPHVTFHGHNEVAARECPVFNYREVLGLDSKGRIVRPLKPTGGFIS